ncbi:T9SS type A sorting domain-containing protein [bacterium]|nr:T9SS type A sorting domain-containing protein [bacterium]
MISNLTTSHSFLTVVCFLLVLLLSFFNTSAQEYRQWQHPETGSYDGVPVREGLHCEMTESGLASNSELQRSCVTWSQADFGNFNVYANQYDQRGEPMWGDEGTVICNAEDIQHEASVFQSQDGTWLLFWKDYRDADINTFCPALYGQRVTPDGEFLWEENGREIISAADAAYSIEMLPDRLGGFYVIQRFTASGPSEINRLDENGELLWENNITVPSDERQLEFSPRWKYSASQDGVLFSFYENSYTLIAEKLSLDGESAWDGPEQVHDSYVGESHSCLLGNSGRSYFVARLRTNDIHAQLIDQNGFRPWGGHGEIINNGAVFPSEIQMIVDEDENITVLWRRNGYNTSNITMQRFRENNGIEFLLNQGQEQIIVSQTERLTQFQSIKMLNGDLFVTWNTDPDPMHYGVGEIYAQIFDAEGIERFEPEEFYSGVRITENYSRPPSIGQPTANSIALAGWMNGQPRFQQINSMFDPDRLAAELDDNATLPFKDIFGSNFLVHEAGGLPLHDGYAGSGKSPQMAKIAGEEALLINWVDDREYADNIILQKLSSVDGSKIWADDDIIAFPGVFEFKDLTGLYYGDYDYVLDQNRYVYCSRTLQNHTNSAVHVQKIDLVSGDIFWGDLGSASNEDFADIGDRNSQLVIAENGEVVVFFTLFPQQTIRAQRFSSDGSRLWGEYGRNVLEFDTGEYCLLEAVSISQDVAILILSASTDHADHDTLYVAEINLNDPGAEQELIRLNNPEFPVINVQIRKISESIYVFWEHFNSGNPEHPLIQFFGQRISDQLEIEWEEEGRILEVPPEVYSDICLSVIPDQSGFWISSTDRYHTSCYIQKYNVDGSPQYEDFWEFSLEDGTPTYCPIIQARNDGDLWLIWSEFIEGYFSGFVTRFTRLTDGGEPAEGYNENGFSLCAQRGDATRNGSILPADNGGFYACWEDFRASDDDPLFDIYAQKVNDGMGFATSVNANKKSLPMEYQLYSPYPNPFNNETQILFDLPKTSQVELRLFDVLGREVLTLLNSSQTAGRHSLSFGSNNLASGIYILSLKSGDFTDQKRMVLLK